MYCVRSYFFFFKQKTAYEMRISDWSSDVCSSDLTSPSVFVLSCRSAILNSWPSKTSTSWPRMSVTMSWPLCESNTNVSAPPPPVMTSLPVDRKSVVQGKSVSVRVDLGGRRLITKQKTERAILRERLKHQPQ